MYVCMYESWQYLIMVDGSLAKLLAQCVPLEVGWEGKVAAICILSKKRYLQTHPCTNSGLSCYGVQYA